MDFDADPNRGLLVLDSVQRAALSHALRRRAGSEPTRLTEELVAHVRADPELPGPTEQCDRLILHFGHNSSPGVVAAQVPEELISVVGALDYTGVTFIVASLCDQGLIESLDGNSRMMVFRDLRLTLLGWKRYAELSRGQVDSRKAFMAMSFSIAELDHVYTTCFRPAVAQTGFTLGRADESPRAGLIDDHMRVAIRTSKFVLADLTSDNCGAYWESGFAEGLGRPVIYTCERRFHEAASTHFDTRNRQTVLWDAQDLARTASDLKAVIRATLPEDAILEDR